MEKIYPTISSIENSFIGYFFKQIVPGSLVLEFGPATGYMTKYMKEQLSCNVTCIELNPEMAVLASPYADNMIVANIDTDPWENMLAGKFNYIILGDVLEHLRDPKNTIKKAMDFLAPNGHIITSIPNIGHNSIILALRKGRFEYTQYGLLDNTHIHFFTRKSMTEMFKENGLICIEERSRLLRPGQTELKEHYCTNPLISFFLFRNRDGHVYQFICKWGRKNATQPNKKIRGYKYSLFKLPILFYFDLKDYLRNKYNIKFHLLPKKNKQ